MGAKWAAESGVRRMAQGQSMGMKPFITQLKQQGVSYSFQLGSVGQRHSLLCVRLVECLYQVSIFCSPSLREMETIRKGPKQGQHEQNLYSHAHLSPPTFAPTPYIVH